MDFDNMTPTRRRVIAAGAGTMAGAGIVRPFGVAAQDATPAATPVSPPDMSGAIFPFELGSFSGHAISDGAGAGANLVPIFFGQTPEDEVAQALDEAGLSPSEIVSQNTLTVIDTGDERVLIDTGTGPQSGLLFDNIEAAGIDRDSIDVVLLTHAHGDHVGGNVDVDGNPAFPNARYVMSQE